MYGDGARLRVASVCTKPYSDKPDHGALLAPISGLKDVAMQIAASKFQYACY
jgi:hypothetical protein